MTKLEKLISKLLNKKSIITYNELRKILIKLGYEEDNKGKTSGSRVAFINRQSMHIIRIHKPHPGNEIKMYAKKYIVKELKDKNLL